MSGALFWLVDFMGEGKVPRRSAQSPLLDFWGTGSPNGARGRADGDLATRYEGTGRGDTGRDGAAQVLGQIFAKSESLFVG